MGSNPIARTKVKRQPVAVTEKRLVLVVHRIGDEYTPPFLQEMKFKIKDKPPHPMKGKRMNRVFWVCDSGLRRMVKQVWKCSNCGQEMVHEVEINGPITTHIDVFTCKCGCRNLEYSQSDRVKGN